MPLWTTSSQVTAIGTGTKTVMTPREAVIRQNQTKPLHKKFSIWKGMDFQRPPAALQLLPILFIRGADRRRNADPAENLHQYNHQ